MDGSKSFSIVALSSEDYQDLLAIWESSVKATHDFLSKEDFEEIRTSLIQDYFPQVELFGAKDEEDKVIAFMGIADDKLEMLFVHDGVRGMGIGIKLLLYAIDNCSVSKVDVNEQNKQAVGFYQKFGFKTIERTELDGQGKPYPLLKMSLRS